MPKKTIPIDQSRPCYLSGTFQSWLWIIMQGQGWWRNWFASCIVPVFSTRLSISKASGQDFHGWIPSYSVKQPREISTTPCSSLFVEFRRTLHWCPIFRTGSPELVQQRTHRGLGLEYLHGYYMRWTAGTYSQCMWRNQNEECWHWFDMGSGLRSFTTLPINRHIWTFHFSKCSHTAILYIDTFWRC
jgi:hypothetical protein